MKGLGAEEFRILGMIAAAASEAQKLVREGLVLPKTLFEFGYIRRDAAGSLQLTRAGERTLFRARCAAALDQCDDDAAAAVAPGVRQWLVNNGFVRDSDAPAGRWTLTPLGQAWRRSLQAESISAPLPPTAESFDMRRKAAKR